MKPYYEDEWTTIYNGDCRELLPELSADLVFDDPPYLEGDWWTLFPMLRAAGKRLVVTPGAKNAYEWTQIQKPFWTYAWLCYSSSLGGISCFKISWEPVLAFDPPVKPLGQDVLPFTVSKQKGIGDHPWPKPLPMMRLLVAHFTKPGQTVLDPHMGVGTTLRAAKDLRRKSIGIEIEERFCEMAAQRLAQEVLAV